VCHRQPRGSVFGAQSEEALNIKDPETDRLARELAAVSGTTIIEALRTALTHELAAARTRATRRPNRAAHIQAIIDRGRQRTWRSQLSEDEILGYDEPGFPTT